MNNLQGVWRGFASDNYAGIHPNVLSAIAQANVGHQVAYGDDAVTAMLGEVMREHFGPQAQVFPVFNGTGANVVSLQAMCKSWESVICSSDAHIHADEGGAPEKVAGLKLHLVDTPDGRLTPDTVRTQAWGFGDEHRAQPKVVSLTQVTELGTVYRPEDVAALVEQAHALGMYVHMDGARIANAAAHLGMPMRAFTSDVGIDAVSLGGTKNGAMGAEAVIILNPELAPAIKFVRKSGMQLASKMRFISAQLVALFEEDLWLKNAHHSNQMAMRLYEAVANIEGLEIERPQANSLFPILPNEVTQKLKEHFAFYIWNHMTGKVRWMCSWDTTAQDVDAFAEAIKASFANR